MRCPVCRATDNQTNQCRRCKADLSLVAGVERARAVHLAAAQGYAGRGDAEQCLAEAQRAHQLRADGESWRLLALGWLLTKDCGQTLACYRHWEAARE